MGRVKEQIADRWWAVWMGVSGLWNARRRDGIIALCMLLDELPGAAKIILYYGEDEFAGGHGHEGE